MFESMQKPKWAAVFATNDNTKKERKRNDDGRPAAIDSKLQ